MIPILEDSFIINFFNFFIICGIGLVLIIMYGVIAESKVGRTSSNVFLKVISPLAVLYDKLPYNAKKIIEVLTVIVSIFVGIALIIITSN